MSGRLADVRSLLEARRMLVGVVPPVPSTAVGSDRTVGTDDPVVVGISLDSRRVTPGVLFAATQGQRADGHAFLDEAVVRGAAAVLVEAPVAGLPAIQLVVHATRPAAALVAAWSAGYPSRRMGVVGITGTDGKTTTSYLVRAILEASGRPTGLLGTVDVIVGGVSLGNKARTTTPEAPELQGSLAAMVDAGDGWAVVEASSHGLAQDRVAEVAWDVAVLTNVTEEHLEFHHTIEAYRAAKLRLFEALAVGEGNPEKGFGKTAVLNVDDGAAESFATDARAAGARVIGYGESGAASIRLTDVRQDAHRLHVGLVTPRWNGTLALHLAGRFNAHNAAAAVAVGEALDLELAAIRAGLEGVEGVPGRMERIDAGQPFVVVVDYAHTAEALAKVLDELAPMAGDGGGGLIAVFGSAGDRDRVKRPAMGHVAGLRCRLIVLTDEDPRTEDRTAILEAIAVGAEEAGRLRDHDLLLVPDRRQAIRTAIAEARPGDVLLLAGKGHEKSIEMADGDIAWDEALEARHALAEAGWDREG
jgi:UDP-N-acetylmuramoyl-L-alanyl-D-glutamate--2,6-diaminopimelate ligase